MIVLSQLQARVYFTIRKNGAMGPKQIGQRLDFEYEVASATVSKPLNKLVELGLVRRLAVNQRVVRYECVHEIAPLFQVLGGEAEPKELTLAN